jgi:hypothetical protein
MELLPIIIVVSLLGFFITLTTILFTWQYLKVRERRRRRRSSGSNHRPTRQLTLRSGQVIPKAEAQDTASTREPISIDLPSPLSPTGPTHTVTFEVDARRDSQPRSMIAAHEHGRPPILADLEAQYQNIDRSEKVSSEPPRRKDPSVITNAPSNSIPPCSGSDRKGSPTVPRPALVDIESRRPSASKSTGSQRSRSNASKSQESQTSRSSREITESLQKGFKITSILGGEASELAISHGISNRSIHIVESGRTSERRPSAQTFDSATVSSRVISDSVQRPPPLFSHVDYTPHVRFAATDDVNRISFFSMTNSTDSSVASGQVSPVSPISRAPPSSKVELARYSPPSAEIPSPIHSASPPPLRDTPPHLDTPEFGEKSFFDSATSSDEPLRLQRDPLHRGVSVMSNRSVLTIASSEISSNWTIGNAKVVNIYPSVAQHAKSPPPYARTLRSKYGRYPRGRRDKALPVIPKSPLSQSEFGPT